MSFWDMTRLLARSWALILVVAALAAAGASAELLSRPTTYVSSSKLLATNQLRVSTYAEMAQTDAVLRPAAQKVGLEATDGELSDHVTTTAPTGRALVVLSVTADTPELAQAFAEAVTESLMEEIRAFETVAGVLTEPIRLVQPAGPAVELTDGSVPRRILIVFAGGVFLGVLLAGLRYLIGLPLRNEREVEALSGAPVIGRLQEEDGQGTLLTVADAEQVHNTVQFLSAGGQRTFAVVDAVPTQLPHRPASALAEGLAASGSRVVLVELEGTPGQGDGPAAPGVSDILVGRVAADEVLQQSSGSPVSRVPAGSPAPNPADLLAIPAATELFRELEEEFDYVIVSGSASLVSKTDSLLGGSILVVTMKDTTDRELTASAAMLLDSAPPVGVLAKARLTRGLSAWWSRVRRRWKQATQSALG